MNCSVCGSQDTTFKEGIAKSGKNAGKPWKAYDCNEPNCKQPNGYPSRTFVNMPKPKSPGGNFGKPGGVTLETLDKKLDAIMKCLNVKMVVPENVQAKAEDDTPF